MNPRRTPRTVPLALVAATLSLLAPTAAAQIGRVIPGQSYFATLEEIYRGEYRQATRGMQAELRGAVKTVQTRWIDSICYHAMLGEVLYHQGLYGAAHEQLNLALELFTANADWLSAVSFQQPPRVDANLGRRLPAWAQPSQPVAYAALPRSFLVAIGRIDNSGVAQQGGMVQQAQYWKSGV